MKKSFLQKFTIFKKSVDEKQRPTHDPMKFISESGYSYKIEEIVNYINNHNFYDRRIFIDFLNPSKGKENPPIFTEKDIEKLLDFPEVMSAVYAAFEFRQKARNLEGGERVSTEELFTQASEYASLIGEKTIQLLREVHRADSSLTSLTRLDEKTYFNTMVEPMVKLHDHLRSLDSTERMALRGFMLTMPYNYEDARGLINTRMPDFRTEWYKYESDLEVDLNEQIFKYKCGTGFPPTLDILAYTIETFKNCQKAIEAKASLTQSV